MKPSSRSSAPSSSKSSSRSRSNQVGRQPLRYVPAHLRQPINNVVDRPGNVKPSHDAEVEMGALSGVRKTGRTPVAGVSHFGRAGTKLDQGRFTKCRYVFLGMMMFAAIFSLSAGLYTRYETYRSRKVGVAPNNTYILSPISSHFCQAVQAHSDSSQYNLTLQLFSRKPTLSNTDDLRITKTLLLLAPKSGYYMVDYFLNEGSTVRADACRQDAGVVNFFVFDSSRQYKAWLEGDSDSYLFSREARSNCSQSSPYMLTVKSDAFYILRWQNDSPGGASARLEFIHVHITRRKYDLNSTEVRECPVQASCSLPIEYGSAESAGVTVGWNPEGSWHDEIFFTWQCVSRDWLYVVTYGSLCAFVLLLMPLSWIGVNKCLAAMQRKSRKMTAEVGETAHLLEAPAAVGLSVNISENTGKSSAKEPS